MIKIKTAVRVITVTVDDRSSAAARLSTSAIPSVIGHGENSVCRNYSRNSEHQLLFLERKIIISSIMLAITTATVFFIFLSPLDSIFNRSVCIFVTVRRISPEPSQNRHTQLSRFPFCSLFPPDNSFCILFYVNIFM